MLWILFSSDSSGFLIDSVIVNCAPRTVALLCFRRCRLNHVRRIVLLVLLRDPLAPASSRCTDEQSVAKVLTHQILYV